MNKIDDFVEKNMPRKNVKFTHKLGYAGLGIGAGMLTRYAAQKYKEKYWERRLIEGKKNKSLTGAIGWSAAMLSFLLPDHEGKYFLFGYGSGYGSYDSIAEYMKKHDIEPISLGEELEHPMRLYHNYHINPALSMKRKEEIILPLFAKTVREMTSKQEQIAAARRIEQLAGIFSSHLSMADMRKLQQWILSVGEYEANEGEVIGDSYDRWRTPAKLVSSYYKLRKIPYDCDCWTLCLSTILSTHNMPFYIVFISQRTTSGDGTLTLFSKKGSLITHPLHHVLPAVLFKGQVWCIEGIRYIPIFPLHEIGHAFSKLKRVVIVKSDGKYCEYEDWKKNLAVAKYGTEYQRKYPLVAQRLIDRGR